MAKYLIRGEEIEDCFIDVRNDKEAEYYVEETYDPEDGVMTLFRLTPICSWPK